METVLIYTHILESMDTSMESTLDLDIGNYSEEELDSPTGLWMKTPSYQPKDLHMVDLLLLCLLWGGPLTATGPWWILSAQSLTAHCQDLT